MTSLLFAGSFIAGKFTTIDLSPLVTTWVRYSITLVFLTGLLLLYQRSAFKINPSDLIALCLLGWFGVVGYHYFFFLSLQYTAIANTAMINATNPVITSLAAAIFLKERLTLKNYWGGLIAFLGTLILLSQGNLNNLFGLKFNLGDGLMFLAVFSWVIYSLILKQLSTKYSGFTLSYYAAVFGVLLLSILVLTENPIAQLQQISKPSLLSVAYMGIGASGLGYLQYTLSVAKIGPTKTASFVYSFVPLFVAILAFLFFQQSITVLMVISMIFIVIGVNLMLTLPPKNLDSIE